MKKITEGSVNFYIPKSSKISKELEVFYNPLMKFNRDTTIYVLNALGIKDLQAGLPLAGTGIRGLRLLKEVKSIKKIYLNDYNPDFKNYFTKNLKLNKEINKDKIELSNTEANKFLLDSKGFDYIDIDPYGTPNPFLDAAIRRLSRRGILAVTATDTSALAGTYPKACLRKYWAQPMRNEVKHEVGLRILIRKIQLVGAQYERALTPILSYSKDHYYRVIFRNEKGKAKVDQILKKHSDFVFNSQTAGPLWMGQLNDKKILSKIREKDKFLETIYQESKTDIVGFFDIHEICKRNKLKRTPTKEEIKEKIKYYPTHITPLGIKTKLKEKEIVKIFTR